MKTIIKPDDYAPIEQWNAYYAMNPNMQRSVGAEGNNDGDGEGDSEGDGDKTEFDPSKYVAKDDFERTQAELEKFKAKAKEADKHRIEQEKAARQAAEEAAKKSGDIEALEKSWAEKYESSISEKSQELDRLQNMVYSLTVGSTATSLAAKLAMDGCADGLQPHIKSRLKTEIVDGEPVVKVLGKDGKPSAMTIEDLEKELKATPYLAPLIKGSSASGAGLMGGKSAGKGEISRDDFQKLSAGQRAKVLKDGVRVV